MQMTKHVQPRRYRRHLTELTVRVEDVKESLALPAPTVETQLEKTRRQELKLIVARDAALRKLAQSPKRILVRNVHRIENELAKVRRDKSGEQNQQPCLSVVEGSTASLHAPVAHRVQK